MLYLQSYSIFFKDFIAAGIMEERNFKQFIDEDEIIHSYDSFIDVDDISAILSKINLTAYYLHRPYTESDILHLCNIIPNAEESILKVLGVSKYVNVNSLNILITNYRDLLTSIQNGIYIDDKSELNALSIILDQLLCEVFAGKEFGNGVGDYYKYLTPMYILDNFDYDIDKYSSSLDDEDLYTETIEE
jgi:hypothetical protein